MLNFIRLNFIRSVVFFCLLSCSENKQPDTLELNYRAFGPQVVAQDIIGSEWWQWQNHGDSKPRKYDIKVIVYKNLSLEQVKQLYPVTPEEHLDYRYVKYATATEYLDRLLSQSQLPVINDRLIRTRTAIHTTLGKPVNHTALRAAP